MTETLQSAQADEASEFDLGKVEVQLSGLLDDPDFQEAPLS